MTIGKSIDALLDTLAALLDLDQVESAKLIIAEAQKRTIGEPGEEPLQWMSDDDFESLLTRIAEEDFRRERLRNPHTGDRWCRRAERVTVGDVVCLAKDQKKAPTPDNAVERVVQRVVADGPDALLFEFTDGGDHLRRRPGDLLVVKKLLDPVPELPKDLHQEVVAAGEKLVVRKDRDSN